MNERHEGLSLLSDFYTFHIFTNNKNDIYRTLGAVHDRWTAIPGHFKGHVSQPKLNGERYVHTTVSGRDGKRVEIQIRTRQMQDVNESGVAVHWSYKDGRRVENPFAVDAFARLASLSGRFGNLDNQDHEEFLEHVKLDMFPDQIFCFTPKGEVIKMPRGATPIDYAYVSMLGSVWVTKGRVVVCGVVWCFEAKFSKHGLKLMWLGMGVCGVPWLSLDQIIILVSGVQAPPPIPNYSYITIQYMIFSTIRHA